MRTMLSFSWNDNVSLNVWYEGYVKAFVGTYPHHLDELIDIEPLLGRNGNRIGNAV